jgi:L-threonylcarbamoyladenylate synthase
MNYKDIIDKSVKVLNEGGVILYPTDTIWGLGCDGSNEEAISKLNSIKKRTQSKHYIILVDSDNKIERYIRKVPDIAWDLIDCANKPTTLVLDNAFNVSKQLLGSDGSLGIRVCKTEFCQQLIRKFNKPLVSTSANITGDPSAIHYNEISSSIKNQVDLIVDLPDLYQSTTKESSIIKLCENNTVKIIRQ